MLKEKDRKEDVTVITAEVKEVEAPVTADSKEFVTEIAEETTAVEENPKVTPAPTIEESAEITPSEENSGKTAVTAAEGSSKTDENLSDQEEAAEETPEIKVDHY